MYYGHLLVKIKIVSTYFHNLLSCGLIISLNFNYIFIFA